MGISTQSFVKVSFRGVNRRKISSPISESLPEVRIFRSFRLLKITRVGQFLMGYGVPIFLIVIYFLSSTTCCWSKPTPQITLSQDVINFHFASGQTDSVDADAAIRVNVQSSVSEWDLHYQANPLVGLNGEIMPARIVVKTPYTNGFESLDMPRLVGQGNATGKESVEVASIQFKYMATGQEKPGTYEGDIFSLDGGPTIHMKMVIEPPVEEAKPSEPIPMIEKEKGKENEKKEPKVKMSLSPDNIHFPVIGTPGEYDADSTILLTVESKYGFMVTAQASPLHSQHSDIPAQRLFVDPGNGNYYSMEKDVVVLESLLNVPQKEKPVSTDLRFRLKTLWDDKAGEYSGEIVFTCMPGE